MTITRLCQCGIFSIKQNMQHKKNQITVTLAMKDNIGKFRKFRVFSLMIICQNAIYHLGLRMITGPFSYFFKKLVE